MLRLPRNSNLAKPSRGRANGPVSETVPRPPPYRRRSRGGLRTVRKLNSRTAPTFSASCHPPARREWTQHLAKVLRLPRNRYLTLRKCCACHEIYTCETFARPCQWARLRDRSETACVQASQPRWFAHSPEAQFTHSANVFCILPSPSSQRVDAAPCESAAPATKSILDLAKVLRLPRNLYLTLRKCCACHAIQSLRNLRAAVPMGPSPNPFRDRLRTGVAAEVVCAQSGSPIHAQRQRFLHLAIPQLAESGRSTLRKRCACHEIDT